MLFGDHLKLVVIEIDLDQNMNVFDRNVDAQSNSPRVNQTRHPLTLLYYWLVVSDLQKSEAHDKTTVCFPNMYICIKIVY